MTPLLIAALALGGVATVGTAAIVLSSTPKKTLGGSTGGSLGGTFNGKAYSDESITEGELAEAASHGNKEASDELARRENIRRARQWCSYVGESDYCGELAKAGNTIGAAIAKIAQKDLAADANTPEQKDRLVHAVAQIVDLGYPPTRFASYAEFGVQEQADTIEEDVSWILNGPVYTAPFMGSINVARLLQYAGSSAIYTAALTGDATTKLNLLFNTLANRRSPIGVLRLVRTSALFDKPPTADNLTSAYPSLAYLACAGAGRYGMPVSKALEAIANNAKVFCTRYGITTRAQALGGGDPENTYFPGVPRVLASLVSEGGPMIMAEAWYGLVSYAEKNGFKAKGPTPKILAPATSKTSSLTVAGCSSCSRPALPRTKGFFS